MTDAKPVLKRVLVVSALVITVVAATRARAGEAQLVEFFDALVAVGQRTQGEAGPLLVFRFGEIMWIFQDASASPRTGVWKNAPVVTAAGEKKFADITITGDAASGCDGCSINRAYLEYLLAIDGISIKTQQPAPAAAAPPAATASQPEARKVSLAVDASKAAPAKHSVAAAAAAEDEIEYTGVIVIATGIGAKRILKPNILTPDKKVVHGYSKNFAYSEIEAVDVIRYASSLEEAKDWKMFLGSNPLVITAIGVSGPHEGDIIISAEDAEKIKKADRKGKFLKYNRVALVL